MKIDPEFRSLIPPLAQEERNQLQQNLFKEGCREALVVWKEEGILLDGHNRHDICEAHRSHWDGGWPPYLVKEISLPNRTAAKIWILRNQLGRRNLNESQRAMLAAQVANLTRGDNQHTPIGGTSQETAATQFNVSERSVSRAKAVLASGTDEVKAAVTAGKLAVSAAAEIATLPKEEQREIAKRSEAEILRRAKEIKRERAKERIEKRTEQKAAAIKQSHPLKGKSFDLICADIERGCSGIKAGSIDAIITDPPYPEEYIQLYGILAQIAARVLRPGGHCLVMAGQSHLPQIYRLLCSQPELKYQWTIGYFTPGQSTQVFGRRVKSNWKPVVWLVKGRCDWEHVEDSVRSDMNDKRFHEWGQSVGGMAQLVQRFTVAKSTILDPFVGGGSTAIAALTLDRLFIGIDNDPACIQETAERIKGVSHVI